MKIEVKGEFIRLVNDASLIQDSKNPYVVEFIFSKDWDDFAKTALFEAGGASIAVVLSDNKCQIPSECLKQAGVRLQIAIYGTNGNKHKSTDWCITSMILYQSGLDLGHSTNTPRPPLPDDAYDQIMAVIGNLADAGFEGKTLAEIIIEIKNSICSTATDQEVQDVLDKTFDVSSGEAGSTEKPDNTATNQEVADILNDVFGKL